MKSQFFLLFPTFLDDKCNLKSNESCEDCVREGVRLMNTSAQDTVRELKIVLQTATDVGLHQTF